MPDGVQEVLARIGADLDEAEREALAQIRPTVLRALMIEARSFSGPVPPPELLREYEAILPGSAGRIFAMAEKQQNHRISLESVAVPAREHRANRGQVFALVVALAGLAVAAYAVGQGQQWAAIAIGGADLAILAGLFVNARGSVARSLKRKRAGDESR